MHRSRYFWLVIIASMAASNTALGAPATLANPLGCGDGRNHGRRQGSWWPKVRSLIDSNRRFFPRGLDTAFLGAWIEHESNGRHGLKRTSLGEVGYFQIHPAEIEDIAGADNVDRVIEAIQASKTENIRWGGALLRHYDKAVAKFGIPRGTPLHHALLKVMHSSRPRGIRWLQHVVAVLGRNPRNYNEFLVTARRLSDGQISAKINKSIPSRLPSCAAGILLNRRDTYLAPSDSRDFPGVVPAWAALSLRSTSAAMAAGAVVGLGAVSSFPGVSFISPLAGVIVASGWWQPRPHRNGSHEGFDMYAPTGTPVLATADGIAKRWTGEFAGQALHVVHKGGWTSRYMHLDRWLVKSGQPVRRGQVIGTVGTTGTKSSKPHLHFAMLLQEQLLALYAREFGAPKKGFGRKHGPGVAVPAEPLIPVAGYEPDVIADARRNGVPLFVPSKLIAGKVFAGIGAVALLGMIGLTLYQQRRT